MSDDDDDRMDRARRIRRMREGQRSNGDGDAAAADDETDQRDEQSEATADPDAASTDESAPPADDEPTDGAGQGDQAVERHARTDGAEQSPEDSMNDPTQASEADASNVTDDGESDPEAIAQRAAQAAAQISSGGADAAGSEEPGPTGSGAVAEAAAAMQEGTTDVELPDQGQIEAAIEAAGGSAETTGVVGDGDESAQSPRMAGSETTTEESTRVLEFTLGDEHYCIDISLVEEIVKRDSITRVPNTDEYIEGVVDLRGQITTILDPKELLDIDADGSESLMIVFDPEAFEDQGAIGWIVDEVRQVTPVLESQVNDPPVHHDYIRGVVDREDTEEFVIWTKPEVAIKLAAIDETDD